MRKLLVKTLNAASSRVWYVGLFTMLVCLGAAVACKSSASASSQDAQAQAPAQPTAPPQYNAADFDPKPGTPAAAKVDGKRAFKLVSDYVAIGPRGLGSAGHKKAEDYIVSHLKDAGAQVDTDEFLAPTAAGKFTIRNIIGKIQGKKDGIIVVAGHYETNLPMSDDIRPATESGETFVGANDSGSNTGLMLELASVLNQQKGNAAAIDGYSVWFVFTDGEEATIKWSKSDSLYGSRHLAAKWAQDGTSKKVKAFLLLDMIGDKDLDIQRDNNSTPWLLDVVLRASQRLKTDSHFFKDSTGMDDDHRPFAELGIPVADLIDFTYGGNNVFHHSSQDTMDKLGAGSLQIVGDVVLETIRALNTK